MGTVESCTHIVHSCAKLIPIAYVLELCKSVHTVHSHTKIIWLHYCICHDQFWQYCTLRKKWSQKGSIPGAVSWYVTQLHPWHYFGVTFKGGAVYLIAIIHFLTRLMWGAVLAPLFEPTCAWAHARWALMHHFLSVCLSVCEKKSD